MVKKHTKHNAPLRTTRINRKRYDPGPKRGWEVIYQNLTFNINIYFKVVEVQIRGSERMPKIGRDPSHPWEVQYSRYPNKAHTGSKVERTSLGGAVVAVQPTHGPEGTVSRKS